MKMTIAEALNLKNSLKSVVSNAQRKMHEVVFGKRTVGGKEEPIPEDALLFEEAYASLGKAMNISNRVNTFLAECNIEFEISETVRQRQNNIALITALEHAQNQSAPTKRFDRDWHDGNYVSVEITYEPFQNKKEFKDKVKALRKTNRALNSKILQANALEINLPVTEKELEEFDI